MTSVTCSGRAGCSDNGWLRGRSWGFRRWCPAGARTSMEVDMRTKMMQLQQLQLALNQAKQAFIGQAGFGRALGAPSGAPGQPQAPQQGPGAPPTSPFQMGGAPPQPQQPMGAGPAGGMSGPSGAMAPQRPPMATAAGMQPQRPPMGGAPPVQQGGGLQSQAQGGPPAGSDPRMQMLNQMLSSGEMDPQAQMQKIGRWIMSAPGNEDLKNHPEALAAAVEQALPMLKSMGMDPMTRFWLENQKIAGGEEKQSQEDQAKLLRQQIEDGVKAELAQMHIGGQQSVADTHEAGANYREDKHEELERITGRGVSTRLERITGRISTRLERITGRISTRLERITGRTKLRPVKTNGCEPVSRMRTIISTRHSSGSRRPSGGSR